MFCLKVEYKCLMKEKLVPKFRQEVKVKVDIVTSDDIKIYYTGKFQGFTAGYIIRFDFMFQSYSTKPKFFVRKVEPIINQGILNEIDVMRGKDIKGVVIYFISVLIVGIISPSASRSATIL